MSHRERRESQISQDARGASEANLKEMLMSGFVNSLVSLFVISIAIAQEPTTRPTRPEVLTVSGIVTCPAEKIFKCFTTGEGIVQAWGVKVAKVDFRVGGMIRTSYDPSVDLDSDQVIGNQILAYEPNRLLIIKPIAPAGAPEDIQEICKVGWNAIYLDPVAPDRTRVTVSGMGYAHTPLLDQAYEKFKAGNAYTIRHMQKALGDPDADARVRKAFDLIKSLVGGEWVCEPKSDEFPSPRACQIWTGDLDNCVVKCRSFMGSSAGMSSEWDTTFSIDPDTGGLGVWAFYRDARTGHGSVQWLDDSRVAVHLRVFSSEQSSQEAYVEISVQGKDTYRARLWTNEASAKLNENPRLDLTYERRKEAPADLKYIPSK
jgi:uncharacterized protein YndB with AHSA1/START domain